MADDKKFLMTCSQELLAAIDQAKGDCPRTAWIESQLWKLKAIRDGAAAAGVENPRRPLDRRGKYDRT